MKKIIMVVLLFLAIGVNAQTPTTDSRKFQNEVVTADNVECGWLNPLRGDVKLKT